MAGGLWAAWFSARPQDAQALVAVALMQKEFTPSLRTTPRGLLSWYRASWQAARRKVWQPSAPTELPLWMEEDDDMAQVSIDHRGECGAGVARMPLSARQFEDLIADGGIDIRVPRTGWLMPEAAGQWSLRCGREVVFLNAATGFTAMGTISHHGPLVDRFSAMPHTVAASASFAQPLQEISVVLVRGRAVGSLSNKGPWRDACAMRVRHALSVIRPALRARIEQWRRRRPL